MESWRLNQQRINRLKDQRQKRQKWRSIERLDAPSICKCNVNVNVNVNVEETSNHYINIEEISSD